MYKQVIVVNKSLNMSPGKLGAMVAHGATSFFCEWFKRNVATALKDEGVSRDTTAYILLGGIHEVK